MVKIEVGSLLGAMGSKPNYDIIFIGGGGHGLATAHYLATKYGEKCIAVVEKGWIGSGNAGRNTTIVRGDYTLPPNTRFYDHSVGLVGKYGAGVELQCHALTAWSAIPAPQRRGEGRPLSQNQHHEDARHRW